ncbi:hypothetical protein D3C78_1151710 [compost metagenome]
MSERSAGDINTSLEQEHVTESQMAGYVNGSLNEQERDYIDEQLAVCDVCLQLFMRTLEAADGGNNESGAYQDAACTELPNMEQMEQRVMGQLLQEQRKAASSEPILEKPIDAQEKPSRRVSWLQHPVTHYTIAASITLLLLGSGVFASFSQKMAEFDTYESMQQPTHTSTPIGEQTESWSDKMVNQTGSWLDGLQAMRFK